MPLICVGIYFSWVIGNPLLVCKVDKEESMFRINALILLQGMCSLSAPFLVYIFLLYMPFGDAMSIVFTAPIFAMSLSKFFLGEACGFYKILCLISLFVGILLILQPPFIFDQSRPTNNFEIIKEPNVTELKFNKGNLGMLSYPEMKIKMQQRCQ